MNGEPDKCAVCGGELLSKQVEKLLRGGSDTAVVMVPAQVCQHCGERFYDPETIRRFEQIRDELTRQQTDNFVPLGRSFRVR